MRANKYRDITCNDLNLEWKDKKVKLCGWVNRIRDHKGVMFFDLRDRYGITQLVFGDHSDEHCRQLLSTIKPEYVVMVEGQVHQRPTGQENQELNTGEVELLVEKMKLLNRCEQLPFDIYRESPVSEELRLKYRFLDLRHQRMLRNMQKRAEVISFIRRFMEQEDFLEIHTPILANSSPEGARDYLVPSRVHPGKFYALPQAPQQFKQLLMVAGFDRYYQIAPCFRDEDARADRSPGEFYQLDLELSFAEQEDIFDIVERLMIQLTQQVGNKQVFQTPFPRFTFKESIERFGTDKPDLRFGMELVELDDIFLNSGFRVFKNTAKDPQSSIRAICVPSGASFSRSSVDKYNKMAKELGGQGLIALTFTDKTDISSNLQKFFSAQELSQVKDKCGAKEKDLVLVCADKWMKACTIMGTFRNLIAEKLGLNQDKSTLAWGWITDFPMYEYSETEKKIVFSHNPFSMPIGGLKTLENEDPMQITAYQYDIFCNGLELSSGAVRNHDPEIMYKAFAIAGYSQEMVDDKFGHMISAFKFGAPPHAGLAPGIERIVMLLTGEPNLREVVPFPKNQRVEDLMLGAPNQVTKQQLQELQIKVHHKKD